MSGGYKHNAAEALRLASHVQRLCGKSPLRQASEIRRLVSRNPTCGISDYYLYGLYDDDRIVTRDLRVFAGWKTGGDISLALNPRSVVAPAWDKILIMLLLDAYGFPRPGVKGMFQPSGRMPAGIPVHLPSLEALQDFLRQPDRYPLYAKPVDSQQGIGGLLMVGFDPAEDALLTRDGGLQIDKFVSRYIHNPSKFYRREAGYLFQEVIRQHEAVSRFQGHDTVSGIRLVVINADGGWVPLRAIWKLTKKTNSNDNFSLGKYGNLIAQVDLGTGRAVYALDGLWPHCRRYDAHPDTGNKFEDFVIPNWGRIIETACEASAMVPKMLIQFWDIAIGPEGPIFIELNDIGGLEILQLHGEGILDARLKSLLKDKGKLRKGSPLQRLLAVQEPAS